jgi:hypothetical protein
MEREGRLIYLAFEMESLLSPEQALQFAQPAEESPCRPRGGRRRAGARARAVECGIATLQKNRHGNWFHEK